MSVQGPAASNAAGGRPPRMIRLRTAIVAVAAGSLLGIGVGAASTNPLPSASPSDFAAASQAATVAPTAATIEPTPEPTPEPTSVPIEPVVVKGSGRQNTKPFDLPGGDLTVVIAGSGDGNVIVTLMPRRDGDAFGEDLYNEISSGKFKYETVVYGLAAGSYYLDAVVDGAWTVTFTALP